MDSWQVTLVQLKERGHYVLRSGKHTDCQFLVGTLPNQRLFSGHRLLLAMASPVFESMFYGSLPEKDNPIDMPDVQPDAFEILLNYIYTDRIDIDSFDNACQLFYVANKYMLQYVCQHCSNFLLANLTPKNACRAYELAKLYEELYLEERTLKFIVNNTLDVITDPSFMDIEASTLMDILDQNHLSIGSELNLFNSLLKLANERGISNDDRNDAGSTTSSDVLVEETEMGMEPDLEAMMHDADDVDDYVWSSAAASSSDGTSGKVVGSNDSASGNVRDIVKDLSITKPVANIINIMHSQRNPIDEALLRQAVKKIRFLAMTPQEFADGPASSKLLRQNEALAIFINISSTSKTKCPMPEGFSQSRKRGHDINYLVERCSVLSAFGKVKRSSGSKRYNSQYHNSSETHTSLTFSVNKNIHLLGVQLDFHDKDDAKQKGDIVGLSVRIQNMQGSEIACGSCTRNFVYSNCKSIFNTPVFIHQNQNHTIDIINEYNYRLILSLWNRVEFGNNVKFSIEANPHSAQFSSTVSGLVFAI